MSKTMEAKLKELEEKEINWDKVKIDASISAMQALLNEKRYIYSL